MGTSKLNGGNNPAMVWQPTQRGVETQLVASCYSCFFYRKQDKFQLDEPVSSYSDIIYFINKNQS